MADPVDLTSYASITVGDQHYALCPPPDNDGKALTLDEMVEHLNTQTGTGPVERWDAQRGALTWVVRRAQASGASIRVP